MPGTNYQKAFANAMLITGPWPTHRLGHDKLQTVLDLMADRGARPDEVLWFLVTYVFDLERRFSMLRVALDDAYAGAQPDEALRTRMWQDEDELNVNGSNGDPRWQHMASIAAAHMRYWLEHADEVNPIQVEGAQAPIIQSMLMRRRPANRRPASTSQSKKATQSRKTATKKSASKKSASKKSASKKSASKKTATKTSAKKAKRSTGRKL